MLRKIPLQEAAGTWAEGLPGVELWVSSDGCVVLVLFLELHLWVFFFFIVVLIFCLRPLFTEQII